MIIVIEGPTAAGKSTWITAHRGDSTVVGETVAGEAAPDPDLDTRDAAAEAEHWAQVNATRWTAAVHAERLGQVVLCDTDPFKLHYAWCLWRIGHRTVTQWRAAMQANRQMFSEQRLGLADLVLVSMPDAATLAARREGDTTRRRRNFGLHARLSQPLRDWYQAVSWLDPARVHWGFPVTGTAGLDGLGPRAPRSGTDVFDALMARLPAR